jgi:hypothetical protein
LSSRDETYRRLTRIAVSEFSDIVQGTRVVEGKLRILVLDGSYIDVWLSEKKPGIYAYHWERRGINGTIYRYNNLPDRKAQKLKTFPKHFHNEKEEKVEESYISDSPEEALRFFLNFVRQRLTT